MDAINGGSRGQGPWLKLGGGGGCGCGGHESGMKDASKVVIKPHRRCFF